MALTVEINMSFSKRELIEMRQGKQLQMKFTKSVVIKDEEIPIEFTINAYDKGAKKKASREAKGRR